MNEYQKYKDQTVYQMSQAELLLFTYDIAINNLKKAQFALDDKNYKLFEDSMKRAGRVISYLNETLDFSQPISNDLSRIYRYLQYDLGRVTAGRERRKDELPRIIKILNELRSGFEGASKKTNDTHIPKEHVTMA